jgi:hypothetical protein
MIRGQARDLALLGSEPDLVLLEQLHAEKTGDLFVAAAAIGALCAKAQAAQQEALARFGQAVGILFQYADDVSDDEHRRHAGAIRERGHRLLAEALAALEGFSQAQVAPLAALARQVGERAAS